MTKEKIIIINFKTYKQGKQVIRLSKQIEKLKNKNIKIIIGVQPSDILEIVNAINKKIKVYSQHVDCQKPGRATGYILPEAIKADKATGSFLNHSEHKLPFKVLKKTVKRCREVGLKTAVFASTLKEAKKIKKLNPDYIIIEPPELVGTKKSVSKAKPELIKKISKKLKTDFLVGAGIHCNDDFRKALEFGASGIAISSAITKSGNPRKKLKEIIS